MPATSMLGLYSRIYGMLQHGWKIALLYLIFLFFVHHRWKIAPVLYIHSFTGTENNTKRHGKSLVLEPSLLNSAKCSALVAYKILELFQY